MNYEELEELLDILYYNYGNIFKFNRGGIVT